MGGGNGRRRLRDKQMLTYPQATGQVWIIFPRALKHISIYPTPVCSSNLAEIPIIHICSDSFKHDDTNAQSVLRWCHTEPETRHPTLDTRHSSDKSRSALRILRCIHGKERIVLQDPNQVADSIRLGRTFPCFRTQQTPKQLTFWSNELLIDPLEGIVP